MTLSVITETTSANEQINTYNQASAMVKREAYSPSPGDAWAIVGCVLADIVEQSDEAAIITAIEALADVTSVHDPRVWAPCPATIEINNGGSTHQLDLHISVSVGATRGYTGRTWSWSDRHIDSLTLDSYLGKNMLVFLVKLPAALTQLSDVTDLETAITGVAGPTFTRLLAEGSVPSNVSGVSLSAEIRFRINPIPT